MTDTERCRKCRYQYDNRVCRFCLDFNKYNPMTNAMKIRSMSDKELAEWILKHDTITYCHGRLNTEQLLEWLKSEVKE